MKKIIALFAAILSFASIQAQTTKTYKVGDYYNDGLKEGVVFSVSADGTKGRIVSMTESGLLNWSSSSSEKLQLVGADSSTDGAYNMSKITAIQGWESKYPAFEWCLRQGEGWYLPSKQELSEIRKNKALIDPKLTDPLTYYWSSTEQNSKIRTGEYCAWIVNMNNTTYYSGKKYMQPVRAVAAFDASKPVAVSSFKTYKIGDFYDDGVKKGYVFEVDASGKSGKLISSFIGEQIHWAYYRKDQYSYTGIDNKKDGYLNQCKIMELPDWRDRFPAFEWCAALGKGWYLPSVDEMLTIKSLIKDLQPKLPFSLKHHFLTSTEQNHSGSSGYYVCVVNPYVDSESIARGKFFGSSVLAVCAFNSTVQTAAPVKKKYNVGDYYDDGKKEGIVFEVSEDGNHGKIISLVQSERMPWCTDPDEAAELIGVNHDTDGAQNQAKIMQIPGWETKYPAFKWCVDLGEGWYLPSKREITKVQQNRHWIESKGVLSDDIASYWTSTESNRLTRDEEVCSWKYFHFSGRVDSDAKTSTAHVRAVATF
jgi:hypothetical protein